MNDATKGKRPSKRDAIVMDTEESINDEPTTKSMKREQEPVSSPEIIALREEVRKLKKQLKKSRRSEKEAESRAEIAENQLASKEEGEAKMMKKIDKLKKKIADLKLTLAQCEQEAPLDLNEPDSDIGSEKNDMKRKKQLKKRVEKKKLAKSTWFEQFAGVPRDSTTQNTVRTEMAMGILSEFAEEEEDIHLEVEEFEKHLPAKYGVTGRKNSEESEEERNSDGDEELSVRKSRSDTFWKAPQCVLCEKHPSTVFAYAEHLQKSHEMTLKKEGMYLKCTCGILVNSYTNDPSHNKKCYGFPFVIHQLEEPSTPQCVMCEKFPSTAHGYVNHLKKKHHNSTLNSNGIYLMCKCGLVVTSVRVNPHRDEMCTGRRFSIHEN